ncbi:MAG TPA: MFS transporter [Candidatus Paceibacterota bacterium]|jgi:MFS family permease|nr:MFS transporter [Candidatus Paceibacterota bacterium]
MKAFNHYHHSKFYSLVHSDFWKFELSVWFHTIGYSIISIFIPILMLVAGYSLTTVMIYCAMFFLLDTPLNFLAKRLVIYFGARLVIILGTLAIILFFALFPYIRGGHFFILFVLALLAAVYDSFYWVAHFYLFIESSEKLEEVGRNNGILTSVRSFGGMLGPAIGAGILIFTTESALLSFSIAFLTLSIIPLLTLQHIKDKPVFKKTSYKEFFRELPEKKNFLTWFLYSIHLGANEVIWPIFIFSLFGTLKSIALVAVIISVSKIILSYASGVSTPKNRENLMRIGMVCILCIWILRLAYPNDAFYYLSILFIGFFGVLIEVPLDSSIFERARLKGQSLNASTFRNTIVMFPQGILFAVLALLVGVFKVSFISATLSLIILLLVNQYILYFSRKNLT